MNSREKGKRGERELAAYLREHGFDGARRGVQYNGADGSADVIGLPGWHIECKRVEALNVEKALSQAEADSIGTTDTPCVFHRRNGEAWKVTIRASTFLGILKEIERRSQNDKPNPGD